MVGSWEKLASALESAHEVWRADMAERARDRAEVERVIRELERERSR